MTVAFCVLVNVQVTVSPAARLIEPIALPSEHVAEVNAHPVGIFTSLTEYVPGARNPLSFGVATSVKKKFAPG